MCRLLECHTFIFGRHLRGTVLLNWFYRALVSRCSLPACAPSPQALRCLLEQGQVLQG